MPISAEYVGRIYPPTPAYCINRAKIVESACAIQDENPAYFGNHSITLPIFAVVIAAQTWGSLFGDEELGLTLHRTVHADQTFDFHRPLREGDDATARLIVGRIRNHGNLNMVTILVALTVDGEVVYGARSALMHTREEAPHD